MGVGQSRIHDSTHHRDPVGRPAHIPLTQLQPGDLLFYYNLDGDHEVDHVVMYAGSGPWGTSTIIAAAHTGTNVSLAPIFTFGLDRRRATMSEVRERRPPPLSSRRTTSRRASPTVTSDCDRCSMHSAPSRPRSSSSTTVRVTTRLHVAHDVYGHLPERLFVQQPRNLGKGAAVRLGIALARGTIVIAADADMAIRPASLPRDPPSPEDRATRAGLSHRTRAASSYESRCAPWPAGSFTVSCATTPAPVRDTQCGCKGFRLGPARLLGLLGMIDRFAYDAEMFYLADQLGLAVKPVTVEWDDVAGSSVKVGRVFAQHARRPSSPEANALRESRRSNLTRRSRSRIVRDATRQGRLQGLVLARGDDHDLLVLPREAALGGLSVATTLEGRLRTAELHEYRHRDFEAV